MSALCRAPASTAPFFAATFRSKRSLSPVLHRTPLDYSGWLTPWAHGERLLLRLCSLASQGNGRPHPSKCCSVDICRSPPSEFLHQKFSCATPEHVCARMPLPSFQAIALCGPFQFPRLRIAVVLARQSITSEASGNTVAVLGVAVGESLRCLDALITQLQYALSCRAAGKPMSRGTQIRSRR